MSALVSIIIPVYNLEGYIGNCLTKTVNQTYKNLEIICIDDGSTDTSADVIKAFCEKDNRVKYVYQENAGVSAARNKGLDTATGDYIMFLDGDDYMHYQAVEIFVKCIVDSEYDVVCALEFVTKSLNENMSQILDYNLLVTQIPDLYSSKNNSGLGKSVCCKIFKSDIVKSVRFNTSTVLGEDFVYLVRIFITHGCVGVLSDYLYYYYQRESSCVNSNFTRNKFSITVTLSDLCESLMNCENDFLRGYCLQYLFQTFFYNRTLAIGTEAEDYVLAESKRIGNKWLKDFVTCKDIDIKIRLMFIVFYYSRPVYELARMLQDPTMKDFYKSRKADRKD